MYRLTEDGRVIWLETVAIVFSSPHLIFCSCRILCVFFSVATILEAYNLERANVWGGSEKAKQNTHENPCAFSQLSN